MLGQMTNLIQTVVNQTDNRVNKRNLNYSTIINGRNIKTTDNKSNKNNESSKISRSELYYREDVRMNPKMNDT
jgi:hypothetical protein